MRKLGRTVSKENISFDGIFIFEENEKVNKNIMKIVMSSQTYISSNFMVYIF